MKSLRIVLIGILLSASVEAGATEEVSREFANDFALGFDLSSFSSNFGGGLQVASPHVLNGRVWFQLAADYAFVQGAKNASTSWFPYGNLRLGVYTGKFLSDVLPFRFYTAGGVVMLINAIQLNSQSTSWGGFGLIGMEYFLEPRTAPFVEFGGMGTGATANQLSTSPIYANGLTLSWGFKWYL